MFLLLINLTIVKAFDLCQAVLNIDCVSRQLVEYWILIAAPIIPWVSSGCDQQFRLHLSQDSCCWVPNISIVTNSLSINRISDDPLSIKWIQTAIPPTRLRSIKCCSRLCLQQFVVCWVPNIDCVTNSLSIEWIRPALPFAIWPALPHAELLLSI